METFTYKLVFHVFPYHSAFFFFFFADSLLQEKPDSKDLFT